MKGFLAILHAGKTDVNMEAFTVGPRFSLDVFTLLPYPNRMNVPTDASAGTVGLSAFASMDAPCTFTLVKWINPEEWGVFGGRRGPFPEMDS